MVTLGDETPPHVELVGRHIRDLEQHGRDQINAFHQFQIDVHVKGHLTLALQFFLLRRALETTLREGMMALNDNKLFLK